MNNTIKKMAVIALVAVAMFLGAQAGFADDFYGDYPNPVDRGNPYAAGLVRARADLDTSINAFWAVYYSSPYDYGRVIGAYYGYVNAYYAYRAYLDAYKRATPTGRTFKGRVMTRDIEPGQVIPMIYPYPGRGVQGAQVQLSTYVPPGQGRPVQLIGTRTTDASGAFSFTGLAAGTYSYSVTRDGYIAQSGTVDVSSNVERTFYITKHRVLSGRVMTPRLFGAPPPDWIDRSPVPVSGARVNLTLINPGGFTAQVVRTATTGADGRFRFDDIPGTEVRLVTQATNYATDSRVQGLSASTTEVTIMLTSTLPPPPVAPPVRRLGVETSPVPDSSLENPFGR